MGRPPAISVALLLVAPLWVACGSKTSLDGAGRGSPEPDRLDGGGVVRADAASIDGSERCDGRDEDGDGRVDEGIADVRCGRGACFASVPGCVDGRTPDCVPGPPGEEVCNEIDDDCDGLIDERLPGSRLSPPVIVRALREGTSGSCEVCDRAFGPTILPTEDGLLALWQLDFLFTEARPNTFVRMLDTTGQPREAPRRMFDTNTTFGMRATAIRDGRSLVTYCERFADGTDHPGSVVIDATGQVLTEPHVYDEENRCTVGAPPVALWRGEHHLVAYSLSAPEGRPFRTLVADAQGVPTRAVHELPVRGDFSRRPPVELLHRPDDVLFYSTGVVALMTDHGELIGAPRTLPSSSDASATALVSASFGYRVFTTVERVTRDPILGETVEHRLRETQLDPDGEPLGPVRDIDEPGELVAAGARGDDGAILIVRSAGEDLRNRLDDSTVILELDADGGAISRTEIPLADEDTWMDLRFVDNGGQKLMVYVVRADGRNHTEVRLRRYGCDP